MNFVFVGENPSKTALEKGWRWKDGRLAAKQLFDALEYCEVKLDDQVFCNVLCNCGKKINFLVLNKLKISKSIIVAMGNKVSDILLAKKIEHIKIPHPAARGKVRKKLTYCKTVYKLLNKHLQ